MVRFSALACYLSIEKPDVPMMFRCTKLRSPRGSATANVETIGGQELPDTIERAELVYLSWDKLTERLRQWPNAAAVHWRRSTVTLSDDKSTRASAYRVKRDQNGACLSDIRHWSAPLSINRFLNRSGLELAIPSPGRQGGVSNQDSRTVLFRNRHFLFHSRENFSPDPHYYQGDANSTCRALPDCCRRARSGTKRSRV